MDSTEHHHEMSIVIVGGGVIGLCTAYNLATLEPESGSKATRPKITVVEANPSTFAAASSHNTGCLHYAFHDPFGNDLTELGKCSFELWQSIAKEDARFVADTGYRPQSFFPVMPGGEKDVEKLPNWVDVQDGWDVDWDSKGAVCATVNPKGIGAWLERRCRAMGVDIRTSTTITSVVRSNTGALKGVECESTTAGTTYAIPCERLVLAAGPWTPSLVALLFPGSTLDLQPTTDAGNWVIFKNGSESTAVVFFDDIVHEKLDTAPPGKQDNPDEGTVSDLIGYSRRYISAKAGCSDDAELQVLEKGRAFRPSMEPGLPYISAAPPKYLSAEHGVDFGPSGLFICFGHGSYGMSLGMGSGKAMAQIVRGEEPGIDVTKFTIK